MLFNKEYTTNEPELIKILDEQSFETPIKLGSRWFMKGNPDPKHLEKCYYISNESEEDLLLVYKEIQNELI